jgi:hypothetical protein
MKLKSTTIVLVLVAAILGGVVYFTQTQTASQTGSSETTGKQIFNFEESQVKALTLKTQLRSLSFEQDSNGIWQMKSPDSTPANDASIAFLLNLMATATSDRTLTVPATDREQFGFHQPLAVIEVTLDNQEKHILTLGEYDFNRSFIYAQADPPVEASDTLQVLLVSPDFENAVSRPLSEWKQGTEPENQAGEESGEATGAEEQESREVGE